MADAAAVVRLSFAETGAVIELDQAQWARLYKEVLAVALRLTFTKNKAQQATAADRSKEATQLAFDRYMRTDPPAAGDTFESVRRYLLGAMRSSLWNEREGAVSRMEADHEAVVEDQTLGGGATASAEVMQVEAGEAARARRHAERATALLRDELRRNDDTIGLDTVDLMAQGVTSPEKQATLLEVDVEEIYAARKRRRRAMEKVEEKLRAQGGGGGADGDADEEEPSS